MKKVLIYGILFSLGVLIALAVFFIRNSSHVEPVVITFVKNAYQQTKFSLTSAPSETLRGTIASASGDIWWQSRVATESSMLVDTSRSVQQGETYVASASGTFILSFPDVCTASAKNNTQLDVVQTLPINIVFGQPEGVVTYASSGSSIISIRSFNAIINLDKGEMTVEVDKETGIINITMISGTATIGYNSPTFVSKLWKLEEGDIFDYYSDERKGYFKASL